MIVSRYNWGKHRKIDAPQKLEVVFEEDSGGKILAVSGNFKRPYQVDDVSKLPRMRKMKHGSVEDKPRDDTGRIQGRQNGETGTDPVIKDTIRAAKRCQPVRTSYLHSPTGWVKGAACRLR